MSWQEILFLPIGAIWAFLHWLLPTTTTGWLVLLVYLNMRDSRKAREAAERAEAVQKEALAAQRAGANRKAVKLY
jgi:hypothetical protein